MGEVFLPLTNAGPEGRGCRQTLMDGWSSQSQLRGEERTCQRCGRFLVLPGLTEVAPGPCFQQGHGKAAPAESLGVTPLSPVFLGLGDVPLCVHTVCSCAKLVAARRTPAGPPQLQLWPLSLSAVCSRGFASASRQETGVQPKFPAQLKKSQLL